MFPNITPQIQETRPALATYRSLGVAIISFFLCLLLFFVIIIVFATLVLIRIWHHDAIQKRNLSTRKRSEHNYAETGIPLTNPISGRRISASFSCASSLVKMSSLIFFPTVKHFKRRSSMLGWSRR